MRTFKVGQDIVKLTERDYKQLLKRFNIHNLNGDRIIAKCICDFYPVNAKCPLNISHSPYCRPTSDCQYILKTLNLNFSNLFLNYSSVWLSNDVEESKEQIKAIHDFLKSLKKEKWASS